MNFFLKTFPRNLPRSRDVIFFTSVRERYIIKSLICSNPACNLLRESQLLIPSKTAPSLAHSLFAQHQMSQFGILKGFNVKRYISFKSSCTRHAYKRWSYTYHIKSLVSAQCIRRFTMKNRLLKGFTAKSRSSKARGRIQSEELIPIKCSRSNNPGFLGGDFSYSRIIRSCRKCWLTDSTNH